MPITQSKVLPFSTIENIIIPILRQLLNFTFGSTILHYSCENLAKKMPFLFIKRLHIYILMFNC